MPAVTWIDMQPESSSRTSLKSFSDYLTETAEDAPVFTPSNRLRLSPETLNALDNAEKLVDDVERQLSQMRLDDSLSDDTEEDGFGGFQLSDERLRVESLVKTVFQKGYYEPAPRTVFNRDRIAWKCTRDSLPQRGTSRVLPTTIDRRAAPVPADKCLLCRFNKADESANQVGFDGREAARTSAGRAEGPKIAEDRPEKLNVQVGPAVSIRGTLAVQTARIVDIQPTQQAAARRPPNIATHECRHLGASDELPAASIAGAPQLERDRLEISSDRQKSSNKSAFDYRRKSGDSDASIADEPSRFWYAGEYEQLHLDDLSLPEPTILVEVDAVLQQQRNVIRQVHQAAEQFDRFLAERMTAQRSDASLHETDRSAGRPVRETLAKIEDQLDRNNKINSFHENPTISLSVGKIMINESKAAGSKKRNSSSAIVSEASNEIFQDTSQSVLPVTTKPSVAESKDKCDSENFEDDSPDSRSESVKSRSLGSEADVHVKNTDRDTSSITSAFVQSSVHTRTKSNAGFIEDLNSSPCMMENILAVNRDDNSRVNRQLSANARRMGTDRSNLSDNKLNRLHVSETDDEQELHNYEFDADFLEEQAKATNKSVDEQVDQLKNDKRTEKLLDNFDENSQKTSHLIDSISGISFHGSSECISNSQESKKMSLASNITKTESPKIEENPVEEASRELSTESKIEIKLSQARDSLKILMKTINVSVNNQADDEPDKVNIVDQELYEIIGTEQQPPVDDHLPQTMKYITVRSNDARSLNSKQLNITNVINQERTDGANDRLFMTILEKNRDVLQNSLEQQKMLLLKNLESCSIQMPKRDKRLFTSTIVGDTCPPVNFTRSRESSTIRQDSLSDSNSEGEIRLSSATSHSLGEIRKSGIENKSSGSVKGSTTTSSANIDDNSSSPSVGEINELNKN
ncbi:uncharacterized protein LOC131671895 isoform X2 [Phymastichus coffea]|nr:uncharacterized protein LOC131671895 isoform X2 [Phymastichus coffea]